ncbi:hypothetical protein PACILC2_57220 [Paenibacillus cisolokensis]|uniref:Uncharacterized protein n=1 Tax=Paenibacillus cisolokensis TaxID=1658519 RepID=A0ABQ4NFW8_9BACL|nr:hypothetical protein PACILC2_57220 [Paenibacillus cisolokensis]
MSLCVSASGENYHYLAVDTAVSFRKTENFTGGQTLEKTIK